MKLVSTAKFIPFLFLFTLSIALNYFYLDSCQSCWLNYQPLVCLKRLRGGGEGGGRHSLIWPKGLCTTELQGIVLRVLSL